jgi:hypothetical protein
VCPCAPTSFPLSSHTPCRLRKAKAHENKKLVKRYLAGKAKYLARKAKYQAGPTVQAIVSPSITPSEAALAEVIEVPESPVRTPVKSSQLLSPSTCAKIATSKANALARKAAIEAGLKCALCAEDITVQNSKDNLCTSCLQVLDVSKEQSEGDKGNNCEVTVKKEKRIKKAQAALKIDFKGANKIEADGSKEKSRIKKKTKVHDM